MFPQEYHKPTPAELAESMRIDFDPRAPKLKLSVFAYLVENDAIQEAQSNEEFMTLLDSVVSYVSQDVADYADYVETFEPELTVGEDVPNPFQFKEGEDPYNEGRFGDGGYR